MDPRIRNITDHAAVSEKAVERYLVRQVADRGGVCLKLSDMTNDGYPDRLCLFPAGVSVFIELKSKGRKRTKLQKERFETLVDLEFPAYVCDSREAVDEVLRLYAR